MAAKVEDVKYDGGRILVESIILDTPKGNKIKSILESGENPFKITTSGIGSVQKDEEGRIVVQDDYQITSVHLISGE